MAQTLGPCYLLGCVTAGKWIRGGIARTQTGHSEMEYRPSQWQHNYSPILVPLIIITALVQKRKLKNRVAYPRSHTSKGPRLDSDPGSSPRPHKKQTSEHEEATKSMKSLWPWCWETLRSHCLSRTWNCVPLRLEAAMDSHNALSLRVKFNAVSLRAATHGNSTEKVPHGFGFT